MNRGLREQPRSRIPTDEYRENYDIIFNRKSDKKAGIPKENSTGEEGGQSKLLKEPQ